MNNIKFYSAIISPAISTSINTQVEQCNYVALSTPKPTNVSAALFKNL